jgi:hypothetical protein
MGLFCWGVCDKDTVGSSLDRRIPACGRLFSEEASAECTLVASLLLRELRCAGTRASSLFPRRFPATRATHSSPSSPESSDPGIDAGSHNGHTPGHRFARRKEVCLPGYPDRSRGVSHGALWSGMEEMHTYGFLTL